MRALAALFKALSDETRLAMLSLLMKRGELCVCDFVEALGISQSKASRHLRHLLNAGFVRDRREGVWVYYRIDDKVGGESRDVRKTAETVLRNRPLQDLEARLDAWQERKKTLGGICPGPSGRKRPAGRT
jgi:ArsR family transcriptional regulator